MKKIFLLTLSSITALFIGLCINPINAFALSPTNIIEQISEENNNNFICLHDSSWSMQNTFCRELSIIEEKLDNVTFGDHITFGNNSYSDIWKTLNENLESDNIFLVSDLWNTYSENLEPTSNKTIIVMVPYYSDFNDGVKHVEDVVTNVFLQKWANSTIHVYYLDDEICSYSNLVDQPLDILDDEPISDEQAAENTAISITEEVDIDESIPRDSLVVFDMSASMYDFMNMLYNQLHEMTTTQKIESMYAFASEVSDEISPDEFDEELWREIDLGGTSNIIGGLRKAAQSSSSAHIYLITDLQNNENSWEIDNNFSGLITVIQYRESNNDDYYADYFYNGIIENYPNAENITRTQAN